MSDKKKITVEGISKGFVDLAVINNVSLDVPGGSYFRHHDVGSDGSFQ
jgi:hypothetical protein